MTMDAQNRLEENEQRRRSEVAAAHVVFDTWLKQPEVKLMISLIPEALHPDALSTLLFASFSAGQIFGSSFTGMYFLETLLKQVRKPD